MRTIIFVIFTVVLNCAAIAQDIPRTLYVLNGSARTVSKLNLDTQQIENDIITVGVVPNRILAKGENVYVVNSTPPGITVIDIKTDQIVQTINLVEGSNPWTMAFVGANKAYVTNYVANSVSVVDLQSGNLLNTISVGLAPEGILVVDNTAYVANTGGFPNFSPSTVSIIDIQKDSVTKTLEVCTNPQDLALASDGNIHVICTGFFESDDGKVYIINPFAPPEFVPAVVDSVLLGGDPGDIQITKDGIAYVTAFGADNKGFLYSYDVFSKEIKYGSSNPLLIGFGAMNVLYDSQTNRLFVSNFKDDTVQEINLSDDSVLQTFPFGDGVIDMTIAGPISASDVWADAVVSFSPGEGAGFGQNFFPDNILGPPDPDPTLNETNASFKPQEILSLGHGGEIILEFIDNHIVDGPGPDFTVFENVFIIFSTNEPFIEAAIVSVSMNGIDFVEFPYDTATFAGLAGVTPTLNNKQFTDPEVSGGDSFDLSTVGLPYARFVKLTDLGDIKKEGLSNGDFDLDAVIAVNSQPGMPTAVADEQNEIPLNFELSQNYPNPFTISNGVLQTRIGFSLKSSSQIRIRIYNLAGQFVRTLVDRPYSPGNYSTVWNGRDHLGILASSGIYFYEMAVGSRRIVKPIVLMN